MSIIRQKDGFNNYSALRSVGIVSRSYLVVSKVESTSTTNSPNSPASPTSLLGPSNSVTHTNTSVLTSQHTSNAVALHLTAFFPFAADFQLAHNTDEIMAWLPWTAMPLYEILSCLLCNTKTNLNRLCPVHHEEPQRETKEIPPNLWVPGHCQNKRKNFPLNQILYVIFFTPKTLQNFRWNQFFKTDLYGIVRRLRMFSLRERVEHSTSLI